MSAIFAITTIFADIGGGAIVVGSKNILPLSLNFGSYSVV